MTYARFLGVATLATDHAADLASVLWIRGLLKTQEDLLNSTRWNFASQLALRLHHPDGTGSDMEFAIRHSSNAGIRCPNRGQDLFTVVIAF